MSNSAGNQHRVMYTSSGQAYTSLGQVKCENPFFVNQGPKSGVILIRIQVNFFFLQEGHSSSGRIGTVIELAHMQCTPYVYMYIMCSYVHTSFTDYG